MGETFDRHLSRASARSDSLPDRAQHLPALAHSKINKMRHLALKSAVLAIALATTGSARAQQFQGATNFPDGTGNYSEGVECADVDHDGDLDIIVADGDGFVSGTARQNRIYINKFIETATPWSIVDESVARFGVHLSDAKGVTTGDVNGDGWVDILFVNAGNAVPSLYINQGAANPGFFTLESATRGFTVGYQSGSAVFADLDDDGDLDVILNDGFNSGTTKKAHLFFNNGAGVFTENVAALGAPTRTSQMDIQIADVDNDWDLDCLGFTKGTAAAASQFLLLNNGAGTFTDSSSLITPATGGTYEAEVGDLDGDNDLDLFFVSLAAGQTEGVDKNNLVPSNSLTFSVQPSFGGTDDNEIALFDYDNDGDYDVLVGSLGAHEFMYRNDGNLTFVDVSAAAIQSISDSTLDCTVADLNNDGKYDIITVQGESGSFINRFYKNTGSADTLPPVITSTKSPPSAVSGTSVVVKAKVRDQVLDDGVNYVTASGDYVILTAPQAALVSITAGSFAPSNLVVAAGTTVTWQNGSGVPQNVVSTSAPYTYNSGSIANGGSYQHIFVKPGTYNYSSPLGGLLGTVTVTGSSNAATTLYMGGQMYRFRMDDTSAATGTQLCYEMRFTDWPGNTRVSDGVCIPLTGSTTGTGLCFGDGSGTACPCGNNSVPAAGEGCLHFGGPGARMFATGAASIGGDTLVLQCATSIPFGPGLYFQGSLPIAGGTVFGNGLLCLTGATPRLEVRFADGAGASQTTVPIHILGSTAAGDLRYYQMWYRDDPSFCVAAGYNLSSALSLTWAP